MARKAPSPPRARLARPAAPVPPAGPVTAGPVTADEWRTLRAETHDLPAVLAETSLPDVLLPYQARLLATTASHAVTLCEKSRRIGVTWGIAADAVLTAGAEKAAGGMDVLYIGYNMDMAREFIDSAGMWSRAFMPAASAVEEFLFQDQDGRGKAERHIHAFRIRFASGFEIAALSSKPRSLRGRQGYLIFDEAAFHDDLAGMMKAALAFLIWGGKILVISTHNGAGNAFHELIEEARKGKKPYAVVKITFDDALRDGLYRRICLVTKTPWTAAGEAAWAEAIRAFYGDDAAEELDVIPAAGGGTYLPMALVEASARDDVPVLRWSCDNAFAALPEHARERECLAWCEDNLAAVLQALPPHAPSYAGGDFARLVDLSVIWPLQIGADMTRVTPFVLELRNVPFEQQRQAMFYVLDRLPRFSGGAFDAGGNGAYLAEVAWQKYGSDTIKQVKFSPQVYAELMPPFKAAFEDRAIVVPRDLDVIADLRMVKLTRGVPMVPRDVKRKGLDGRERHGDAAIAACLAHYATRAETVGYGYEAPARRLGGFTDGGRLAAIDDDDRGPLRAPARAWSRGAF